MAHHIEAAYDGSDNSFLPPLRTLGFNPKLTMNDSLLVQSYIEAYDLSYPEALRRIESEVTELRQHLENEGSYELNDICVLALNDEGALVFTPCEAGILTPALYGLSSFEMKTLDQMKSQSQGQAPGAAPSELVPMTAIPVATQPLEEREEPRQEEEPAYVIATDEEDEEQTIEIKMSWVRNAVAIAAAVIAFFLMTTPVINSGEPGKNIGNLHNPVLAGMTPKDTNMEKIDIKPVEATPIAKTDSALKADPPKTVPAEQKATVKEGYTIVLASYITRKNADAFVEQLHRKGFSEAEVFIRKNVTRVILGSFTSEGNAYNRLRTLRDDKDFEEAWVMEI